MQIHATLDAAGQPVQIPDAQAFTSWWKIVEDASDVAASLGLPLGARAPFELTHAAGALARWDEAMFARWCVQAVDVADPPYGQQLAGVTLSVDAGGTITAEPVLEPVPIETLRTAKLAAAVAAYEAQRQSPFAWDFGAAATKDDFGADGGPAGAQTLQMREGPVDDQKNWLVAQATCGVLEAAGAGATVFALKATSNLWVQTTASQVLDVLVRGDGAQTSAAQRGLAQLQHVGALKAQIGAAADAAALAAIDETVGWPQ